MEINLDKLVTHNMQTTVTAKNPNSKVSIFKILHCTHEDKFGLALTQFEALDPDLSKRELNEYTRMRRHSHAK